jgi:hypothetical protein
MLVGGYNHLAGEPWRRATGAERRLSPELQAELRAALPAAPAPEELRRALDAAIAAYASLRERLAAERGMPLADELARQVRPWLDPSSARRSASRSERA